MRIRSVTRGASASAAAAAWCMSSFSSAWVMPFGLPMPPFSLGRGGGTTCDIGPPPSDAQIESESMKWIKRNVIGLNLCPFAERPVKTGRLSTVVVRGDDHATVTEAVSMALLSKREEAGTTIVIAPEYYPQDFDKYMSMVRFLEEAVMEYHELKGHVQIACFHPLFTFNGSGNNVDNYTNRSPYPMFHVLREDEVARATKKLDGDPGKVWRRNVKLLENLEKKLGREAMVDMMMGTAEDEGRESVGNSMDEVMEEVLKQTRADVERMEAEGGEKQVIRGVYSSASSL